MWLPADLFQDYTCAVWEMFNLVKTSQIHLSYTEIKKTPVICEIAHWGFEGSLKDLNQNILFIKNCSESLGLPSSWPTFGAPLLRN